MNQGKTDCKRKIAVSRRIAGGGARTLERGPFLA